MTDREVVALSECRILVVEDEYLIAEEVARALEREGADVIGPAPTLILGLELLARVPDLDAAVLDVNLNGTLVWPLVDALLGRGVPMLLATGYDAAVIPPAYAQLPRHEKPFTPAALVHALVEQIAGRW